MQTIHRDIILYTLTALLVVLTFWQINDHRKVVVVEPELSKELNELEEDRPVLPINPDKPIREYVLWEAKRAGLDPNFVDRLIRCESNWRPDVESPQGDRGLFQINRRWHPNVSDECAFDYVCNTREAIKIIKSWGGYTAWICSKLI